MYNDYWQRLFAKDRTLAFKRLRKRIGLHKRILQRKTIAGSKRRRYEERLASLEIMLKHYLA